MEETLVTSILSEEMEKLGSRIMDDLKNTLVGLDGNLKDIAYGTLIKIPQGAGYVTLSCSEKPYSKKSLEIKVWMSESLLEEQEVDLEDKYD